MTIDLYYHPHSPASTVVVALIKHLKLTEQINFKEMDLRSGATRTPEFLKLNPAHTVPTLVEDGGAFVISESRAILQYLVNRFKPGSSLYPSDINTRAQVDRILFYDASSFFPSVGKVLMLKHHRNQEPTEEQLNELKDKVQILDALLSEKKFFAGNEITIADISLCMCFNGLKNTYPNLVTDQLREWHARVETAVPELSK